MRQSINLWFFVTGGYLDACPACAIEVLERDGKSFTSSLASVG